MHEMSKDREGEKGTLRELDIIAGIGLFLLAIVDIKKKKISIYSVVIFSIILFIIRVWEGVTFGAFFLGLLPGIVLLLLAICSGEKVGIGDGLVLCALGMGYELEDIVGILGSSFLTLAITGIGLLITKRATKKTELPMIPYFFIGYCFVVWIK